MSRVLLQAILPTARRSQREGFRLTEPVIRACTDNETAAFYKKMLLHMGGRLRHNPNNYRENLKVYNWITTERVKRASRGQIHGHATYSVLLEFCVSAKTFKFADILVKEMIEKKIKHRIHIDNLLIILDAKRGIDPFNRMKNFKKEYNNKQVSSKAQFAIFGYLSRDNNSEQLAMKFYSEISKPELRLTAVALSCCNTDENISFLYNKLNPYFDKTNGLWYLAQVSLLNICLRNLLVDKADGIVTELEKRKSQKTSNYNILILIYIRARVPHRYEEVLLRMAENNCKVDITSYSTFFYAMSELVGKGNDEFILKRSTALYERMLADGFRKYQKTYGSYMKVLAALRQLSIADEVRRLQWISGVKESSEFIELYSDCVKRSGYSTKGVFQLPLSKYEGEAYPLDNFKHTKSSSTSEDLSKQQRVDEVHDCGSPISRLEQTISKTPTYGGELVTDSNKEYFNVIARAGFSCEPPKSKSLQQDTDGNWYKNIDNRRGGGGENNKPKASADRLSLNDKLVGL